MDDRYDLRNRGDLRRPSRYPDSNNGGAEQRDVCRIRAQCKGKEKAISKRINQVREMICCRGSRTKISSLSKQLEGVYKETVLLQQGLAEAVGEMVEEEECGTDWIENLHMQVDDCSSDVAEYLEERINDAPSRAMSETARSVNDFDDRSVKSFSDFTTQKVEGWRQANPSMAAVVDQLKSLELSEPAENKLAIDQLSIPEAVLEIGSCTKPLHVRFKSQEQQPLEHQYPLEFAGQEIEHQRQQRQLELAEAQDPDLQRQQQPRSEGEQQECELQQQLESKQQEVQSQMQERQRERHKSQQRQEQQLEQQRQLQLQRQQQSQQKERDLLLQQQRLQQQQQQIQQQQQQLREQQQQLQSERQQSERQHSLKQKQQVPLRTQLPSVGEMQLNLTPGDQFSVDEWIDYLPGHENHTHVNADIPSSVAVSRWIMNQSLPGVVIPQFNGDALKWVEFVTHFKEMVHEQPYLSTAQRMTYLMQYVEGEAKRSISGYGNKWDDYCKALKRLKFMFGNTVRVAQAYLYKLIKGKAVKDHDMEALTDLYYNISDCLSNLKRLNYSSDLGSMEVLYQVLKLLPPHLLSKWREHSYHLQRTSQPSLVHLEAWLQDRLMALKDPYTPSISSGSHYKGHSGKDMPSYATTLRRECLICKEEHHVSKCNEFLAMKQQKRFEFVVAEKLCYNCLKAGHSFDKCTSRHCYEDGCTRKHNTALHEHFSTKPTPKEVDETDRLKKDRKANPCDSSTKEDRLKISATGWKSTGKQTFLLIVPVKVSLPGQKEVDTYAFLDDGSEGTFIRADFAKSIGLKGQEERVSVSTILSKGRSLRTENVSFQVQGLHAGSKPFQVNNAITLPKKYFKVRSQQLPPELNASDNYKHLQGLGLRNVSNEEISILVGVDNYELTLIKEVREGKQGHPIAVRTELGWSAFGYEDCAYIVGQTHVNHIEIETLVESFWRTESFGTEFSAKKSTSIEDRELLEKMESTSTVVNNKLEVGMLWKGNMGPMPDNFQMAEKRFRSLQMKLRKNPELFKKYSANLSDYVVKGYARKMQHSEIKITGPKTWYLPHHPVSNPNKPEKLRIVMDAAAKKDGMCLNDCIHTGPDLTNNLIGVLLRFRNHPIAIVADIESMFHQVSVNERDRDALRFLWTDNINSNDPPDVYQMTVHIFGAKDSPCCAGFALRKTAIDNKNTFSNLAINTVLRDFYVDDLLKSVESDIIARHLIHELKEMLMSRGFNLTKFFSNSASALSGVDSRDLGKYKEIMELEKSPVERTLGILWDMKGDKFTFNFNLKRECISDTKRGVLKTVSSVFDPLGFLAPFLVRAKILLQNLWRRKRDWDDKLGGDEVKLWHNWLAELQDVKHFRIKRCYMLMIGVQQRELHIFVDASEQAFGAVAYMRVLYTNGKVTNTFVMAKSRLAPIKPLTIPRLELQAAVLGTRLKTSIMDEIDVELHEFTFWTDSMHVLQYISNEKRRFLVFVANRVAEIREHSDVNQWRYIPGEENPADDLTRGLHIRDLNESSRWVNGPGFLLAEQTCWPPNKTVPGLNNDDVEVKISTTSVKNTDNPLLEQFKRYSSWQRLLNVVAWILRFVSNARGKERKLYGYLTVPELRDSMNVVIKVAQTELFDSELQQLRNKKPIPQRSVILQLQPFIGSDELLRVGGRLRKAEISTDARHQIILHATSLVAKLLVTHEHKLNFLDGIESLLVALRQRFWIIGVRRLTKRVLKNCFDCKRRNSKPTIPVMADLPDYRVKIGCPVFFNTGVDFFGPIPVKFRRGTIKRWGSIFTCLSTRAIHLEVVEGLDTDSFINTLRRFTNRRGHPKMIVSDCGSNFKGADTELKAARKELDQNRIGKFASEREIEWKFNPPESPHMG